MTTTPTLRDAAQLLLSALAFRDAAVFSGDREKVKFAADKVYDAADDLRAALAAPADAPPKWPKDAADVRQFMKGNCLLLEWAVDEATPHQDDRYQLTAHDFLSAVNWWADFPNVQPAADALAEPVARAPYLQPDDMAALERLDECFEDDQEYDVPKPAMQRLAELGVVRHHAAGRYSITTFGRIVLGCRLYRFPLETMNECNDRLGREAAAIRAKGQQ